MEFKSKKSIYLQIADYICECILREEWKEDEKIPSIRDIAVTLEVNPNTVTRTYRYLEEQGIISIQRGVGYFVSKNAYDIILDLKKETFFKEELPELFRMMKLLSITIQDVLKFYNKWAKK